VALFVAHGVEGYLMSKAILSGEEGASMQHSPNYFGLLSLRLHVEYVIILLFRY